MIDPKDAIDRAVAVPASEACALISTIPTITKKPLARTIDFLNIGFSKKGLSASPMVCSGTTASKAVMMPERIGCWAENDSNDFNDIS